MPLAIEYWIKMPEEQEKGLTKIGCRLDWSSGYGFPNPIIRRLMMGVRLSQQETQNNRPTP